MAAQRQSTLPQLMCPFIQYGAMGNQRNNVSSKKAGLEKQDAVLPDWHADHRDYSFWDVEWFLKGL